MTLAELAIALTVGRQQPAIIGATQLPIIPTAAAAAAAKEPTAKEQAAKVVIKQIVKQTVGVRRQRKRKATAGNQKIVKEKRKEYMMVKREVKKRLTAEKTAALKVALEGAKALPSKERTAAKNKIRAEHKQKFAVLLKNMPAVGKRSLSDIVSLLKKLKALKW
jgi:hypothetical protein